MALTHFQFLANSPNKLPIPIYGFPNWISNHIETVNESENQNSLQNWQRNGKESKVGVSLKRQFYFIYLLLLLPQNFSH